MLWAIREITLYEESEPAREARQKHDHTEYWFWIALVGFIIELILCFAMFIMGKKVNPFGEGEVRIADHTEMEMNRLHGIPEEALGRGSPVRQRSLGAAYQQNRIEAIASRIARAAEDIDARMQRSDDYVPVPTEERERY